ncbi:MAG: hypothetical protein VKJ06_06685 [Vampirovibrionales bacterium]|nr:hypothetical protein [Vampirovibrionales bacterium]
MSTISLDHTQPKQFTFGQDSSIKAASSKAAPVALQTATAGKAQTVQAQQTDTSATSAAPAAGSINTKNSNPVSQSGVALIETYRWVKHRSPLKGFFKKTGILGRCQHAQCNKACCSTMGLNAFKTLPPLQATLVTTHYIFTCGKDAPNLPEKKPTPKPPAFTQAEWFKALEPALNTVVKVARPVFNAIAQSSNALHQALFGKSVDQVTEAIEQTLKAEHKPLKASA